MKSFQIHNSAGGTTLHFSGEIPQGLEGYDGCHFIVSVNGGPVEATVRVYDIQPHLWTAFFADLALNWKGWIGEKTRESLEHHIRITATSDSLGHISLRVYLRDIDSGTDWRIEDTIFVDAGQLEHIAKSAAAFFG